MKDDNILKINDVDIEDYLNNSKFQINNTLFVKKYISNIWSNIIDSLLEQGSQYFAITINLVGLSYSSNSISDINIVELEKKRIKNWLEVIPKQPFNNHYQVVLINKNLHKTGYSTTKRFY